MQPWTSYASAILLLLVLRESHAPAAAQIRVCEPCEISAVNDVLAVGKAVLVKLDADPTYEPGPLDIPTSAYRFRAQLDDLEHSRCECELERTGGRLEAKFFEAVLDDRGDLDNTCSLRNIVAGLRLTRAAVFLATRRPSLLAPRIEVEDPETGRINKVAGPPVPWRLREALWIVGDVLEQCSSQPLR